MNPAAAWAAGVLSLANAVLLWRCWSPCTRRGGPAGWTQPDASRVGPLIEVGLGLYAAAAVFAVRWQSPPAWGQMRPFRPCRTGG